MTLSLLPEKNIESYYIIPTHYAFEYGRIILIINQIDNSVLFRTASLSSTENT